MRFGGLRIFLHLDQVDPVVHFASSASVQHEATMEIGTLYGMAPSLVFMHTAFSIQIASSVLYKTIACDRV